MEIEYFKINQDKCHVDKRHIILDFDFGGKNYAFERNGWVGEGPHLNPNLADHTGRLEIDGKVNRKDFSLIEHYKHRIFAYIKTEGDQYVIIDRRYEHNRSFDVYFRGQHYLVGEEKHATIPTDHPPSHT